MTTPHIIYSTSLGASATKAKQSVLLVKRGEDLWVGFHFKHKQQQHYFQPRRVLWRVWFRCSVSKISADGQHNTALPGADTQTKTTTATDDETNRERANTCGDGREAKD